MKGTRFLRSIRLTNFLSYGETGAEIELEPLNVLIGPNGSGKSNLIEAVGLLHAAPKDLSDPIRKGGGVREWLWKGGEASDAARIEAVASYPDGIMPLRYKLAFDEVGQNCEIVDEVVENQEPTSPKEEDVYFFYRYQNGHPVLNVRQEIQEKAGTDKGRRRRSLQHEEVTAGQSVLSQRKDPDQYPEITYLGNQFSAIRIFREWNLGRNTEPRKPQPADLAGDFLSADAANLGLVVSDLVHRGGGIRQVLVEKLTEFYPRVTDITTKTQGGTVQLFLHEEGLRSPVPATRLSDGTLRFLCLLTILCHPEPPPLVCIEEPELDLHPDILPLVAEMFVEASERMQLIVTTHSDLLVSALTDVCEAVVICERDNNGTQLRRLDSEALQDWIEDYTVGELWQMGELGGTRW
jgi:predicted ATPase